MRGSTRPFRITVPGITRTTKERVATIDEARKK
jgi:hypothetical protein